jgi:hypothetical protein
MKKSTSVVPRLRLACVLASLAVKLASETDAHVAVANGDDHAVIRSDPGNACCGAGHYPQIWQELEGLAQGLEATVDQVFAWNCRGDLVRSTSDGCTTVAGINAAGERIIAHNEDGFPSYG